MLKDESLEYIQEQFEEKNMILEEYGEPVSAWTMYEDIFGGMEQVFPVVIIDEDREEESDEVEKHIVPLPLGEAIEQCVGRNDMLLGGCTYFNNWISKRSAKDIYTFIIDMDNVYSGTLLNALRNDWKTANNEVLPMPTYIVNSGTGLHLYFVLSEPIPNYKVSTGELDRLYRALAIQQTTKRVYLKREVQWFGQDFRMVGGLNKYQWENTAFRVGEKWDIDELAKSVGLSDVHFIRYGEKRKRKPMQESRKKFVKRKGWKSNRSFYDYTLQNCRDKTREGNRYTSMCALSVIAWKCGVPKEELEQDLKSLLPTYNKDAKRLIKEKEFYSAMKMYNDKAMLTQRASLENWQGWEFKPATTRHSGRQKFPRKKTEEARAKGLKNTNLEVRAWAVRDAMYPDGEWRGSGRPSAEQTVRSWQESHSDGRKADCVRDTGLDPKTVRKWWNEKV